MGVGDAQTIGARLRHIRNSRKKSLRVVAGLAGMSKSRLSEIERGESALDEAAGASTPTVARMPRSKPYGERY